MKNYRDIVSLITRYFDSVGIHSAKDITPKSIIGFCNTLAVYEQGHKHNIIFVLRNSLTFFRYAGFIEQDLACVVPTIRYDHTAKLPSVYSEEELAHMLECVDTSTPVGKRNYAMLLLVDCTGIRSSDATGLTFSSIDWENDRIELVPKKTNKNRLVFPLYPELGEAIKDYLFNGRPVCDEDQEDYVFLTDVPPYRKMHPSTFASIVENSLKKAGIYTDGRKTGPHAIRHSLATAMLNKGQPITEVAKILDHVIAPVACHRTALSAWHETAPQAVTGWKSGRGQAERGPITVSERFHVQQQSSPCSHQPACAEAEKHRLPTGQSVLQIPSGYRWPDQLPGLQRP